jgi:hypothetical protein
MFVIPVYAQNEAGPHCKNAEMLFAETMPCFVDTLSWVEVTYQGDVLKRYKSELEKFARLRMRNDLSVLKHETKNLSSLIDEYGVDPSNAEIRRRARLHCHIWTVGSDYPIALHVNCKLNGFGLYPISISDPIESANLGYGSKDKMKGMAEDMIESNIRQIATEFYEVRDASN